LIDSPESDPLPPKLSAEAQVGEDRLSEWLEATTEAVKVSEQAAITAVLSVDLAICCVVNGGLSFVCLFMAPTL
jgi:hypothetical protein